MTRWRVDHEIRSDFILAKTQNQVVFKAPDKSHVIYLMTRRGPGKHAADELYLSSHVILDEQEAMDAVEKAEAYLSHFLETLAIVTSVCYRIEGRTLVVDWSPGLNSRRCISFKKFPNPDVPKYALTQDLVDTVMKYSTNPIPLNVRLAMSWWARGVATSFAPDQFQFFWYALEILTEHHKPTTKITSKCPHCSGDLHCQSCGTVPLHRPYPKQAVKILIEKHLTRDPDVFFKQMDEARNRLLHGDDQKLIEQDMGVDWGTLSDRLGRLTWLSLLDTLRKITMEHSSRETVAIVQTNSYLHYDVILRSDLTIGVHHVNPLEPQIDEFQLPGLEISMVVGEHADSVQEGAANPMPKHHESP